MPEAAARRPCDNRQARRHRALGRPRRLPRGAGADLRRALRHLAGAGEERRAAAQGRRRGGSPGRPLRGGADARGVGAPQEADPLDLPADAPAAVASRRPEPREHAARRLRQGLLGDPLGGHTESAGSGHRRPEGRRREHRHAAHRRRRQRLRPDARGARRPAGGGLAAVPGVVEARRPGAGGRARLPRRLHRGVDRGLQRRPRAAGIDGSAPRRRRGGRPTGSGEGEPGNRGPARRPESGAGVPAGPRGRRIRPGRRRPARRQPPPRGDRGPGDCAARRHRAAGPGDPAGAGHRPPRRRPRTGPASRPRASACAASRCAKRAANRTTPRLRARTQRGFLHPQRATA